MCHPGDGVEDAIVGEGSGDLRPLAADGRDRNRELHEKIGEPTVERDFLEGALGKFPGQRGKR